MGEAAPDYTLEGVSHHTPQHWTQGAAVRVEVEAPERRMLELSLSLRPISLVVPPLVQRGSHIRLFGPENGMDSSPRLTA